ncbi:MAG: PAS domain-containing protein [Verrucomicrobiae bacterium]|nr:PAS domain-containing protein [Verrucomicrobiae bacterium]
MIKPEKSHGPLPWWTWIAPLAIFHLCTRISVPFAIGTGLSFWYLPLVIGFVLVHWWGPRVLIGLYVNSVISCGLWGANNVMLFPLYGIAETVVVFLSWWLFQQRLRGNSSLPDVQQLFLFLLVGVFVPLAVGGVLRETHLKFGEGNPTPFWTAYFTGLIVDMSGAMTFSVPLMMVGSYWMSRWGLTLKRGYERVSLVEWPESGTRLSLRTELILLYVLILGLKMTPGLPPSLVAFEVVALWGAVRFGVGTGILLNTWIIVLYLARMLFFKDNPLGFDWDYSDGQILNHLDMTLMMLAVIVAGSSVSGARKKLQENIRITRQLDSHKQLVEASFYSSAVGMCLLDARGVIREANPAFLGFLEDPSGERIPGRNFGEWVVEEDRGKFQGVMDRIGDGTLTRDRHYIRCRTLTGGIVWADAHMSAVDDDAGKPGLILLQMTDITSQRNAERALEQSRQMVTSLFENTHAFIYTKDSEGRYVQANKRFESLIKRPLSDLIGRRDHDFFPQDVADRFTANDRKVLEEGRELTVEESFVDNGEERVFISIKFPLRDEAGKSDLLCGISTEITERRNLEKLRQKQMQRSVQFQAAVLQLSTGGHMLKGDVGEALEEVVSLLTANLHVDRASVWYFDEGDRILRCTVLLDTRTGEYSSGMELKAEYCPSYIKSVHEGRAIVAVKAALHPATWEFARDYLPHSRVVSMLDVPIRIEGRVRGVVCVEHGQERSWTEDEVSFAGQVADQTALVVAAGERRRYEAELFRERNFISTILNTIGALVIVLDPQGRIVRFNQACEKCTGYLFPEVEGRAFWDFLIRPDEMEGVRQTFDQLKAGDFPLAYENYWISKNGENRWISWTNSVILDAKGKIRYVIGSGLDQTEKKLLEDKIEQASREFSRSGNQSILEVLLEQLSVILDADITLIGELMPGSRERVRTLAVHSGGVIVPNFEYPLAGTPCEKALEKTVCTFRDGVAEDFPTDQMLAQFSIRGYVGTAILGSDGQPVGIVAALYKKPIQDERVVESMLRIFATRAGAEMERKAMEEKLFQSHKMEAIGQLAGGIAHDFNNMLTPIRGFAELVINDLSETDPHREQLRIIHKAALQAEELTRQLLAYGRKQVFQLRVCDLESIVQSFRKLFRRTLREDIEMEVKIPGGLGCVEADSTQINHVLMNLALNAQDAMPDGGRITLELREQVLGEDRTDAPPDIPSGDYLVLSVTDTGCGISPDVARHIFEPFFTTKPLGKGTGLGLAMVYGIIKQHNGGITMTSEPGKGTSFQLYFPKIQRRENPVPESVDIPVSAAKGSGRILVVEDNAMVRKFTCTALEGCGYTALSASSLEEAMQVMDECETKVDLLLTDVIMPLINGRQLYERLLQVQPGLRVLYMSGYPSEVIARHGFLEEGVRLLHKPFSIEELMAALITELRR